jgi:hypothetical protein
MPENEARAGAFYDHETEEPRTTGRRRRQVADWGVGEDVFDRLPSRRFERRDHRHAPRREPEERPAREVADWTDLRDDDAWADAPRTRRFAPAGDDGVRRDEPARRATADAPVRRRPADEPPRRERRPAADWLAEVTPRPAPDVELDEDGGRTIVLGGAVEGELAPLEEETPKPRRTVVIGGHPDKLPAPRPRRPPRTAVERLGSSPDRIMAYAVALGLLLILIAVLTTSH